MAVVTIRSARPAAHDHSETDQVPVVSAGIASSAVVYGKIGTNAVVTDNIASTAVTTAKVVDALRENIYVGDETEVTSTATTADTIKTFKLLRDPTYGLDPSKLSWNVECKHSAASGTTNYVLMIDTTGTMGTGSTVGTTYGILTGSTAVSLTTGTHQIDLQLFTTTGTAYNRMFELYAFT
jgi:hypothetical protein